MRVLENFKSILETVEYEEIKVLSLDIFDTLIFRMTQSPSDIFLEMGKFLKDQYKLKITPFEFKQIRIMAEQKAREIKNKEYSIRDVFLYEIYKCMPKVCCNSDELEELELEFEKKYCYINPQIHELINICKLKGIEVVLTSDMYLSAEQIKKILKCNGLNLELIDQWFISCEKTVSKSDNGNLFEFIIKEYSTIKPHEILHIGDSLTSDVINAERFCIRTFHYNTLSFDKGTLFEREKIKYGNLVPEILALRKLVCNDNYKYNKNEKIWFEFGAAVLGPFLSLFCEWVIDIANRENIKEIYPLMREGYILEKMLKNIVEYRNYDIKIKPMYVSRKAIFLPSLNFFDKVVLKKIFERNNFTVKDLFDNLKIEDYIGKFKLYEDVKLEDSYEINLENNNLRNELFDYILSGKIKNVIENNIKNQRELFLQYLKQNFNFDNGFITVDLGFRGTMQSALDEILKSCKQSESIHLLAFGEECIKNNLLLGQDIRGFIGNAGENIDIVKSITWCPDIIEELMMGDIGSTIGYKMGEYGVEFVLDKNRIPKDELKLKEVCMEGVLKFQTMYLKLINYKPFIKDRILENRIDIGKILERFYKMPTYNEAITFSKLHHEDNFGSKNASKLIEEHKVKILDKVTVEKFLKLANPKDFKWPEALVTIKYANYLLKKEIENGSKEGYLKTMCTIAENVSISGISEIMVYGSGEAGIYLMRALELYDIKVIYLIDRNENLHGKFINDTEIISLERAIEKRNHTYAIGSFAFKYEIEKDILNKYIDTMIKPKIFILQDLF